MKVINLGVDVDEKYFQFLDSEFEKYANKNGIECKYKPFTYIAEENNKTIGIITGKSYYDEVSIDDLIVSEEYRHNNIGSQLVNTVISDFKNKGYRSVTLTTYEFQALEFYKKLGFQLEFSRENVENPKLTKYFLKKDY